MVAKIRVCSRWISEWMPELLKSLTLESSRNLEPATLALPFNDASSLTDSADAASCTRNRRIVVGVGAAAGSTDTRVGVGGGAASPY